MLRQLFQQLYNWIRYKTLPVSVLFKNRLFLERDSKNKRISNNFGLAFRNSKWNNYEMFNIKHNFKYNLFLFFLLIFCLILTPYCYYFNIYVMNSFFFNNVFFIVWTCVDTFDYYLSFFTWLFITALSLFFNLSYSYFFFNKFSKQKANGFAQESLNIKKIKNDFKLDKPCLPISKKDYKWFLFVWLNNKSFNNNKQTSFKKTILSNLFSEHYVKTNWMFYSTFYVELYKLVFFLNLIDNGSSLYNLKLSLSKFKTIFNSKLAYNFTQSSVLFIEKYQNIILNFYLSKINNYFNVKNKFFQTTPFLNHEWNLISINADLNAYSTTLNKKTTLFYINDLCLQNLISNLNNFMELINLPNIINNQLNFSKWNRWLYRYSTLHRKIFKNSHKLTISKKIINSGFYNIDLTKKNIWLSEFFRKYKNTDLTNYFSRLLYNNFLEKNSLIFTQNNLLYSNNFDTTFNLKLNANYESSFFWALKRFYFYNSLNSNNINQVFILKKNTIIADNLNKNSKFLNKHYFLINNLATSYILNFSQFFIKNYENDLFIKNDLFIWKLKNKDVFLFLTDNNLYKKNNSTLLCYFSMQCPIFFSYYHNFINANTTANFKKCKFKKHNFTFPKLNKNLLGLKNDNFLLNDLALVTIFK